jgi:hypothetical protein
MARVNRRLTLLLALAIAALSAAPAHAFDATEGWAAADRAAIAWSRDHQQRDGAFVDYVSRRPTYGYANVMIGYGLLQAGVRRDDQRLIRRGFDAIEVVLESDHPQRGVFDALANATAYEFALRKLSGDSAFVALRPRWETYLRSISQPYIKSTGLQACTADPACFHNHEAVGAFGDLQLLKTELRSTVPGAKLADPEGLRVAALHVLTVEIPGAMGEGGLLSDTGTWPLAYHDFSTAMVAGAAADLGDELPDVTREALRRAVNTMSGFMGPDGDVAYLGRRQQQAWALASAIYAATVARRFGERRAGRLQSVADRAFIRLTATNRFGPGGIGAVPRPLSPRSGFHGVDANEVVPAALVIFLLNLAADEAAAAGASPRPAPLRADADSSFLEPDQTGFATVRHGDLWYAVHRRTITYDLRYDFGMVALKRRGADGKWRDVVRPRPNTRGPAHDSAGPVIVEDGVRYLPFGDSISARDGGVVLVRGGFRSEEGVWLRRGVTFRFAPVERGVELSFPLEAGDAARVVTFLPEDEAREDGRTVTDESSSSTVSLRPANVRFGKGYASCCDEHLVAATMSLQPERDQTVRWTVQARAEAPPPAARRARAEEEGGSPLFAYLAAASGLIGLATAVAVLWRRRRARAPG